VKIGLMLPLYNDYTTLGFSLSLWKTRWPKDAVIQIAVSKAMWVCNALKSMTEQHLAWGADFLVYLSSDITWQQDDIKKLVEHNLPIVGGWASGRCHPFHCHVCDKYYEDKKMFRTVVNPKERHGLEKIAANGGEMLVFRRDIFDKIPSPWFLGPEMCTGDRLQTEDYFFSRQCTKYGIDMWVDWDIRLRHATTGVETFNGDLVV